MIVRGVTCGITKLRAKHIGRHFSRRITQVKLESHDDAQHRKTRSSCGCSSTDNT